MKILYFEPYSGASGDMILGALVDLGIDFYDIKVFLEEKLDIKIIEKKCIKNGIFSTKIDVIEKNIENKESKTYSELIQKVNNLNLNHFIKK